MAKKKKGSVPPQLQKGKGKPVGGVKPPAGGPPGSQNLPPGMPMKGPKGNGGPANGPSNGSPPKKKGKGKVPPQFLNKSKGK